MKIIPVFLTERFVTENTERQRYREIETDDYLISSKQVITALPLLALAGLGMGHGGSRRQAFELSNYGMHIAKQWHNGIARPGKRENCQFYDAIDREEHTQTPPMLSPLRPFYLVTDNSEAEKTQLSKGVIFYNESEAKKFAEDYASLGAYQQSSYYHKPEALSLMTTEKDYPRFEAELSRFLDRHNASFTVQVTTFRRELNENHFLASYLTEDDGETELIAQNGTRILSIDFPEEITNKELQLYFPKTLGISTEIDREMDERLTQVLEELPTDLEIAIDTIDKFLLEDDESLQYPDEHSAIEKVERYVNTAQANSARERLKLFGNTPKPEQKALKQEAKSDKEQFNKKPPR